jgi:hypothetical protein
MDLRQWEVRKFLVTRADCVTLPEGWEPFASTAWGGGFVVIARRQVPTGSASRYDG